MPDYVCDPRDRFVGLPDSVIITREMNKVIRSFVLELISISSLLETSSCYKGIKSEHFISGNDEVPYKKRHTYTYKGAVVAEFEWVVGTYSVGCIGNFTPQHSGFVMSCRKVFVGVSTFKYVSKLGAAIIKSSQHPAMSYKEMLFNRSFGEI